VSAAEPDLDVKLDPGIACTFPLHLIGVNDQRVSPDSNGNPVTILAGIGRDLTFTNLDTGASVSFPTNGSVERKTLNANGTTTVEAIGHNVLIFFPGDEPAGPSTTLFVGRVVYLDDHGTFTLLSKSGRETDICALLD